MSRPPPKGACPHGDGVFFRVWAPGKREVEVVIEDPEHRVIHLGKSPDGMFSGFVPGLGAGALYRYRLDGQGPFPDPASRFQPQGIHGPSEVMDPARFSWTDRGWQGASRENLVIYELHVGTFSPEGTFEGATRRLPQLAGLGVTAIELMPVADFPGSRNWGYDGVSLFAPARCYGRPDDLRNLVDEAHRLGLAVLLDVVYNHLGPDGNYLAQFTPYYFSNRHQTLWGPAINLDGEQSDQVRSFFFENALCWLSEYHLDDRLPQNLCREGARAIPRALPGQRCEFILNPNLGGISYADLVVEHADDQGDVLSLEADAALFQEFDHPLDVVRAAGDARSD